MVSACKSVKEFNRSAKSVSHLLSVDNYRATMNNFPPSRQSGAASGGNGYCSDCGQTWDFPTCRTRLPNYSYPHSDRTSVDNVSLGTFYAPNGTNPQVGYFVPFYENISPNFRNNYYESPLIRKRWERHAQNNSSSIRALLRRMPLTHTNWWPALCIHFTSLLSNWGLLMTLNLLLLLIPGVAFMNP